MPESMPDASTRQLILAAALDAFNRNGYGSTSMSEIRRAAAVSTGSLYHHFAGKEYIAAALLDDGVSAYQDGFLVALRANWPAEAGVRAGVAFHLRWARRNRALARFVLGALDADIVDAADAQGGRAFLREVHGWLTAHVQAGAIRELPRELYYPVWIGPSQELTRQWLRDRSRVSLAAAEAELGDCAWTALRAA